MKQNLSLALAFAAGAVLVGVGLPMISKSSGAAGVDEDSVKQIVRQVINDEPQLILDSVRNMQNKEQQDKVVAATMVGGATLTGLLGTSAWYAPGAAIGQIVESILRDEKKIIPSCVYLNGEYGQKDICIGVPVVIGRTGWEKIINLRLSNAEKEAFEKSAEAVRAMNAAL